MKLNQYPSSLTRILMPVVGCFSLTLATLSFAEAQGTTSPPGVGSVSIPGGPVSSPATIPGASNPTGTSNSALTGIPSSSSVDNGTGGFGSMGTDLNTHSQSSLYGSPPPPTTSGCVGVGCGTLPLPAQPPGVTNNQQAGQSGSGTTFGTDTLLESDTTTSSGTTGTGTSTSTGSSSNTTGTTNNLGQPPIGSSP